MSERWVSQQRKFCKFCNCWYGNDKISIENHEKGASHQANVEKELNKTRQTKSDLARAERAFMAEMHRIEAAAIRSLEEDAKRDILAREELERVRQAKAKAETRR